MPFSLIPLIIILICAGALLVMCIRKFPELSGFNVEETREAAAAKKKMALIEGRFQRVSAFLTQRASSLFLPVMQWWRKAQQGFRKKVALSKELLSLEKEQAEQRAGQEMPAEKSDRIERLLQQADSYFEGGRFDDAERGYLEVLRLESKHIAAYRGLGKVYMKKGAYREAHDTFSYLLRLTPHDDTIYVKLGKVALLQGDKKAAQRCYEQALIMNPQVPIRHFEIAEIYKELGNLKKARQHSKHAVELEPTNPRYLDGFLEISILLGDREGSKELFQRLRLVNPENKKLDELRDRIEKMPT